MKVPREMRTYCPRCDKHQIHRVSLYHRGRRRALAEGERRHRRKKKGYGGQKYPLQKKFAKTTKKQTLILECEECGHKRHKEGIRLSRIKIEKKR